MIVTLVFSVLLLAGCGGSANSGNNVASVKRPDTPAEYAGKTNPYAGNTEAIAAGQKIYETNCSTCHGDKGMGDGPAGAALDPHPADLQNTVKETDAAYQFYRISEGGSVMNSSMPMWKGILKEDEIWQVVSYMQTLK